MRGDAGTAGKRAAGVRPRDSLRLIQSWGKDAEGIEFHIAEV